MITSVAKLKAMRTAFRPSHKNVPALLLCLGVIGVYVFVFALPRGLENKTLTQRITEQEAMIQVQRKLYPVQHQLRDMLDEPLPGKLHQGLLAGEMHLELEEASPRIQAMAEDAALDVRFIRPDATALARDGVLLVDCSLSGETPRLWDFLLDLAENPWLLNVQSLEISSGRTGEEFRLRLLIAMVQG